MVDDYDLTACLEYNPESFIGSDVGTDLCFGIEDIAEILAVWEGTHDEEDWVWILRRKEESLPNPRAPKFIWLQAGCDYTGWDCRSWITEIEYDHDISRIEERLQKFLNVRISLLKQLNEGKAETWREKMDKEFGLCK